MIYNLDFDLTKHYRAPSCKPSAQAQNGQGVCVGVAMATPHALLGHFLEIEPSLAPQPPVLPCQTLCCTHPSWRLVSWVNDKKKTATGRGKLRSTPNILRIARVSVHHSPTKNNLPSPKIQLKQVNDLLGALIT